MELEVIKPEVNGPEIYDQVDFEPDPVELPNNHTLNMTPEEENNIGQLKLWRLHKIPKLYKILL